MPPRVLRKCKLCLEKKESYFLITEKFFERNLESICETASGIELQKYVLDQFEFCFDCTVSIIHSSNVITKLRAAIAKLRIKKEFKPKPARRKSVAARKSVQKTDSSDAVEIKNELNDTTINQSQLSELDSDGEQNENDNHDSSEASDNEDDDLNKQIKLPTPQQKKNVSENAVKVPLENGTSAKSAIKTTPKVQTKKQTPNKNKGKVAVDSVKKNASSDQKKTEDLPPISPAKAVKSTAKAAKPAEAVKTPQIKSSTSESIKNSGKKSAKKNSVEKKKEEQNTDSYNIESDVSETEQHIVLPKLFKSPELNASKVETANKKIKKENSITPRKSVNGVNIHSPLAFFKKISETPKDTPTQKKTSESILDDSLGLNDFEKLVNSFSQSQEDSEEDNIKISQKASKRKRDESLNDTVSYVEDADSSDMIELIKKKKAECQTCGKSFKSMKKYDKHILKNACSDF